MSDTPRCDSEVVGFDDETRFHLGRTAWYIPADFARQLERELEIMRIRVIDREEKIEQYENNYSRLERELNEARIGRDVLVNMFDRIEREAFSLDDTIGGEQHDAYIIRKVSQLKAEIEALKQEIAELNKRDGCA